MNSMSPVPKNKKNFHKLYGIVRITRTIAYVPRHEYHPDDIWAKERRNAHILCNVKALILNAHDKIFMCVIYVEQIKQDAELYEKNKRKDEFE